MGLFLKPGIIYVFMSSNLECYLYQQGLSGYQGQTALLSKVKVPKKRVFFLQINFAFVHPHSNIQPLKSE
jgi:hypothetical protein